MDEDTKQLIIELREFLVNHFSLYVQTHTYHWNVVGPEFPQLHKFFQKQYEDLWEEVDVIAEKLRQMGAFVPNILNLTSKIGDFDNHPDSKSMLENLKTSHELVLENVNNVFASAQKVNNQSIMNYAADRMDYHKKIIWQLRSTLK